MAVILDEAGLSLLDEALLSIFDEAGAPPSNVTGAVATVTVAAPTGAASAYSIVVVQATMSFQAHTAVTAQATMGFMAGQPVQAGLSTLATDPWISMYPG